MPQQFTTEPVRISLADWLFEEEASQEPRHEITVVASRCGVRTTTVRRYEEWGLIESVQTGRRRLYSEADIDQILRVRRLMNDLGVNLAGAAAVLHLRQQVIGLQRELQALRRQIDR
jgi:MerR family transcriptional regulator/heat shock protein HspR